MTPFEYISVIISIILGLGVAQIVTGLAHFAHGSSKVKIYWPHLLWIIMIFFFHLQEWWVFYEYKEFTTWKFPTFIFVLLYPIGLFVTARLLFPFDDFEQVTDLKKFYFENYRSYFGLIGIQGILSIIDNMTLRGFGIQDQFLQMGIITLMFSVAFFKIRKEWVHKALAIFLSIGVIISLIADVAGGPIK